LLMPIGKRIDALGVKPMKYDKAMAGKLTKGYKWYVVYTHGEDEYIQAKSHNDAEKKANCMYKDNLGVSYTEL